MENFPASKRLGLDLSACSIEDLFALNGEVVARLKGLLDLRRQSRLDRFADGDLVQFLRRGYYRDGMIVGIGRKRLEILDLLSEESHWVDPLWVRPPLPTGQ